MKKFLLSMVAIVVAFVASAAVVTFDNSASNWAKVNAYCFGGDGEILGKWPGTAMTAGADNTYTVDVPGTPTHIIFNNGTGAQTGNLVYEPGATYNKDGKVGAAKQHIYFKNTADWSTVYIYTFQPEMFGGWPGQQVQANADGLYPFEYTAAPAGVIFHNNAGGQTPDIKDFNDGDIFDAKGKLVTGDEPIDPTPVGDKELYLVGEFCSWNFGSAVKLDHEEGTDVYTATTDQLSAGNWKLSTDDWSFNYGMGDSYAMDVENDCWFKGQDFTAVPVSGEVTVTFTLVAGSDVENGGIPAKIKLVGGGDPIDPDPVVEEKDVYVIGGFCGWALGSALKMDHEEGTNVYTLTTDQLGDPDGWKLCDGTWAWSFGMGDDFAESVENDCWFNGQNFSPLQGTVNLQFTYVAGSGVQDSGVPSKILYTITNSIDTVMAEEAAEAVYYNLQGVRVAVPQQGNLYIVKRADKVSKEIAR